MAGNTDGLGVCSIRASVTTGLESMAAKEVSEKLDSSDVEVDRGAVTWSQGADTATKALHLRIVENLEVIMSKFQVDYADEPEEAINQISKLLLEVDWTTGLHVWSKFTDFSYPVSPKFITEADSDAEMREKGDSSDGVTQKPIPSFRATCYRTGQNHKFSSVEVAHKVGGQINNLFGWKVDLKNFDIEVVIHIVDNDVSFGIGLTKGSLFKRNISHFSKTTLKSTIAAGLLKFADIKPSEIVLDPMCGSGSITVEGALEYPESFHMAGDNQEYCVQCSINNILDMNEYIKSDNFYKGQRLNASVMCWDATKLPLQTASIDAIVSDLPFGKRMGSKVDNRKLYPAFLTEAARITVPAKGRAVLLTSDKHCINRILPSVREWWAVPRISTINHGGLRACVYVLKRTAKLWL